MLAPRRSGQRDQQGEASLTWTTQQGNAARNEGELMESRLTLGFYSFNTYLTFSDLSFCKRSKTQLTLTDIEVLNNSVQACQKSPNQKV